MKEESMTASVGEPAAAGTEGLASPSFTDLVATFAKIGFLSFGGAAGQIAMMHAIVVDEKKWLDERRFQHALAYCMLLPGPEAQQLATYIGWLTHGVRGGLAAGVLFVLPGALLMLALSFLYMLGTGLSLVDGLFFGVKAAVVAIVVHALLKIAARGLRTRPLYALAATAFLAMLTLDVAFPWIVLGAMAIGALLAYVAPAWLGFGGPETQRPAGVPPGATRGAFAAALCCLVAWWAPVALAALALGGDHFLVAVGLYFSKLAVVTFGGAYAVLAYLAQSAVEMGWVTTGQMIDGLGLAETTPGPTILVNQFVAFVGGWDKASGLPPWLGASLAAAMATWVTFAPSFLWIFGGAPFVDAIRRDRRLAGALAGVTAAVVGVIAFVTLWFGLHVLFREVGEGRAGPLRYFWVSPASLDVAAAALCLVAFALLFGLHRGIVATVAICAALGVTLRFAGF
jgi:chromate transporter